MPTKKRRLAAVADLANLGANESVRNLGTALIQRHALPLKAETDTCQIALAAVQG